MTRVAWERPELHPRRIQRENVTIADLQQHQQPLRRETREQRRAIRERPIKDLIARARTPEPYFLGRGKRVRLNIRDTLRAPTRHDLLADPLLRLGVEHHAVAKGGVEITQHGLRDFDREPGAGLAPEMDRAAVTIGDGRDDRLAVAMRVPETKRV